MEMKIIVEVNCSVFNFRLNKGSPVGKGDTSMGKLKPLNTWSVVPRALFIGLVITTSMFNLCLESSLLSRCVMFRNC